MADPKDKPTGQPKEAGKPEATGVVAAAAEETEEWIFTINTQSGDVVKVEKSEKAGERRELTEEEYAAISDEGSYDDYSTYEEYGAYGYDPYSSYAAQSYDPYAYEEGYYQGVADYEASLAYGAGTEGYEGSENTEEGFSYTPEQEAAYYQGMSDYASAIGY